MSIFAKSQWDLRGFTLIARPAKAGLAEAAGKLVLIPSLDEAAIADLRGNYFSI